MTPAQFQSLQNKWYKRLEKTGFTDIEEPESQRGWLKAWHAHFWASRVKNEGLARVQAKADYYLFAAQYSAVHKFDSAVSKAIWDSHAEAETVGPAVHRIGCKRSTYNKVVKETRKAMFIHYGITKT